MPTQIFLIRHGETAWSISGQHTGRTDVPLTAAGEHQAARLRGVLEGITFAQILTSPLQRARRTCALAGLEAGAQAEPELHEWDYGAYEGRTTPEIWRERPDWRLFADGCPEGESLEQVAGRADRLLGRLRLKAGNTALFSHGHFLRVLAVRWLGQPVQNGGQLVLDPGTVSILGHERATPAITLWNGDSIPEPRR